MTLHGVINHNTTLCISTTMKTSKHIQSVSKMLRQPSRVSLPYKNKEKNAYQYMSPLSLQGTAQQPVNLDHLDFHLWGHLQPLVYSSPTENEERHYQHIFDARQTICKYPRTFKRV